MVGVLQSCLPTVLGGSTRSLFLAKGKDEGQPPRGRAQAVVRCCMFWGHSHRAGDISSPPPSLCRVSQVTSGTAAEPAAAWQQPLHDAGSHIVHCAHSTSHPTALQPRSLSRWHKRHSPGTPASPPGQGTTSRPRHPTRTGQVMCPRPPSEKLWRRHVAQTKPRSSWRRKTSFPTCKSRAFPKQHLFRCRWLQLGCGDPQLRLELCAG